MRFNKLFATLYLLPAWIVYLFSRLSVRSAEVVVFGTHTDSFSGNIKALFLEEDKQHTKVFISADSDLVKKLVETGHRAHTRFSARGIYYCLRAGSYVYSSYPSDVNFWLSGGAGYINVWHGTPIKKIERDVSTGYYSLRNTHSWIYWIMAPYLLVKPDTLLVSSAYEENCFKTAFNIDDESFFRAFPPRLEPLAIGQAAQNQGANILYVPTWRDDHSFTFSDHVDMESFNNFLHENGVRFFVKQHPSDTSSMPGKNYSQIVVIEKHEDVYDYLEKADSVVSDYSSMIFDSLYLEKPVVLFCPDYESYQKSSRDLYIDPTKDLPVLVSCTQADLENEILSALARKKFSLDKFEDFRHYPRRRALLSQLIDVAHNN